MRNRYKLFFVLIASQCTLSYGMREILDEIDSRKHIPQQNIRFRISLAKIQKDSQTILLEDVKKIIRFRTSERDQIQASIGKIKSALKLHEQDKAGFLIYYKNFTQVILNDICLDAKDWIIYKRKKK